MSPAPRAPKAPRVGKEPKAKKEVVPTGIFEIDRLGDQGPCTIADYVTAASAYVRRQSSLAPENRGAGWPS
jgi:hypothetical protein